MKPIKKERKNDPSFLSHGAQVRPLVRAYLVGQSFAFWGVDFGDDVEGLVTLGIGGGKGGRKGVGVEIYQ